MDGRRHSVDVPISRTLVALRRVRSLRDPSTNSMSKLTTLWDTNSCNVITLGFQNNCSGLSNDNNVPGGRRSTLVGEEQHMRDDEKYHGSRRCNSRLVPPEALEGMVGNRGSTHQRSLHVNGSDARPFDPEMVFDDKALSERCCKDYGDKDLKFDCTMPSGDCVKGGGSCNEPDELLGHIEKRHGGGSKCKIEHRKLDGLPSVTGGDVSSRAGSPCLSVRKAAKEQFSNGTSLYRKEDISFMESCHQGFGIGRCWSRTRKFKELNFLPDVEERPLLLQSRDEVQSTRESIDWKHNCQGVSLFVESPRSICQRFIPKSFSELVGQNTVATSLLNAISRRQITSLYLFHGPRGTGKTSTSRILAAALNCLSLESAKPCSLCQECDRFFSGRSRDVKEVDSVIINKREMCRSLIKNAQIPPVFSRFKVYIIDECHQLQRETWATILNNLEELPRHVIFIMVTPSLDKLPRSAVSKSQRYHFQKVKEVDITSKLGKICIQEGLDFDQDALNFVATKSNGSLRDAEMMLDQLSLLGKKITMSLVYEVNGVVSHDELLDLLYLALSSDASNTVKRARELMQSMIDPLQFISQLESLVMDILAGKCPDGASETRRKLFVNNSEAEMQRLSHALKILSQTKEQLKESDNQTTWLIVALLQLSSKGSSFDVSDARLSIPLHPQDPDFPSTSSNGESLKRPVPCACLGAKLGKTGMQSDKETLELVWIRATQICTSSSLKKFLLKRGKLLSIHISRGIAVAELEFDHPDYVSKAEKSWKMIAGALQHLLGYNVELRINPVDNGPNKYGKFKKTCLSLFNCSRRVHLRSQFSAKCQNDASENSDSFPKTFMTRDKYVETCSSEYGSQISCACCHGKGLLKTIWNNDGNTLSIEASAQNRLVPGCMARENKLGSYPLNVGINKECQNSVLFKPESKKGPKEYSKFHCWRSVMLPFQKAWQLRHHDRTEHLVDYALHCAAAK